MPVIIALRSRFTAGIYDNGHAVVEPSRFRGTLDDDTIGVCPEAVYGTGGQRLRAGIQPAPHARAVYGQSRNG